MALALYFSGTPPCPFYCCHSLSLSLTLLMRNYAQLLSVRHQWTLTPLWSYDFVLLCPWQSNWPFFIWKSKHVSDWTVVVRVERKERIARKKKRKNRRIRIEKLILKFEEEWWILIQSYLTVGANILELSRSHFPSLSFLLLFSPLCSFFFYCLRLLLTRWPILSLICTQNRHPCLHTDWVCSR